jgi:CubicO group peptidase (beta-lactamase class C family)
VARIDERILATVDGWGAGTVAVAVVDSSGVIAARGPLDAPLPWASVTKPLTAVTALAAVDRGLLSLDEPAGPPGSTVRHLLAHASGLMPDATTPISPPGRTRIYSNVGFDLLGDLVAERAREPFGNVARTLVLEPLEMNATRVEGPASRSAVGSAADLARLARELMTPAVLPPALIAEATRVAFPGLRGVLPGFGLQDPNDWGLGFEIRGTKSPHWTGMRNSPATFGHFGRSGTFVWIDPVALVGLACLTDRPFGPWAAEAWPRLSDAVVAAWATS